MIRKSGKGYTVYSHTTGRKLSKAYSSRKAAAKRLGQIKGFAARKRGR